MLRYSLSLALLAAFFNAAFAAEKPALRVVGYLPEYRLAEFSPDAARGLTDLIFFSVLPEPDGKFSAPILDEPATRKLLDGVRKQKIRIHLCIGGWDRSQKFAEIAGTAESRKSFAAGAIAFCRTREFAGIDLDWEHPADESQQQNYGLLLEELARVFHADKREVSLAMAGWQQLADNAFRAVDAVNLMSYDGPQRHSTFEQAVEEVGSLRKRKVPAAKIRLGLPFYGRGIEERDKVLTYAQIVQQHAPKPNVNEMDGLYFNGPDLIRKKLDWARQQKLGGVMIWEIGQDAPGDVSLLKLIGKLAR